ncbi:hypothetical protein ACM66B_000825 [Microbotryomycetes sp. NB124-2]
MDSLQHFGPLWQPALALLNKAQGRPPQHIDQHTQYYLGRFIHHLTLFPRDGEFLLEPTPGAFGVVTCMESSCYLDIQLTAESNDPNDGGRPYGVGSFAAFHNHIKESEAHRTARDARQATAAKIAQDIMNKQQPRTVAQARPPARPKPVAVRRPTPGYTPRLPDTAPYAPGPSQAAPAMQTPVRYGGASSSSSSAGPSGSSSALKRGPSSSTSLEKRPYSPSGLEPANKRLMTATNVTKTTAPALHPRHPPTLESLKAEIDISHGLLAEWRTTRQEYASIFKKPHVMSDEQRDWASAVIKNANSKIAEIEQRQLELFGKQIALEKVERQRAVAAPVASTSKGGLASALFHPLAKAASSAAVLLNPAGLMDDSSDEPDYPELDYGLGSYLANQADFEEFLHTVQGADFEGNATVQEAAAKLKLSRQTDKIPGMSVPLLPHQLIGVAWMYDQEVEGKNYGAILADDMGLGKTIQTIGLLCKNPSKEAECKTTLIVAPVALLGQWADEIEEKCRANQFSVLIYHGDGRKEIQKKKHLLRYDVVLTSYHTLLTDCPDEEGAEKRAKKEAKKNGHPQNWQQYVQTQKKGLLFQVEWFRVVLDEAHFIRNRATRMSRAVTQLDSLFRWCLTGTPILNSLGDIFPLLRFLQVKPWYEWKTFNDHIVIEEKKNPNLAATRAQAILASCMIRRRKDTKLDGKELVTLPEKACDDTMLELTPEERSIYDAVEKKSQVAFNKFMKAGTVMKNYANVLTMLLRLRQVCLHPALIIEGEDILATSKTAEEELARAKMLLGALAVKRIQESRLAVAKERAEKERSAREGEEIEMEADECPICFSAVQESEDGGVYTKCGHLFCRTCILEVLAKEAEEDGANGPGRFKADERPCPNCRAPISGAMLFPLSVFEPSDEELEPFLTVPPSPEKKPASTTVKEEQVDSKPIVLDSDDEEEDKGPITKKLTQFNRAIIQDSGDEDEEMPTLGEITNKSASALKRVGKGKGKEKSKNELPGWMAHQEPSTKMKWALDEVIRVHEDCPDDKFIIISSFTTALDMVDDMFAAHDIKTVRYQGDMSRDMREKAVRVLRKSNKCYVMLLSLHSGGVGLNLTRANRVISLDLAWNKACESQAFDRCHRIGQLKKVQINRMMIDKTVEQRIADLQNRKQNLADGALAEGKGQKIKRLTVAELANLFGLDRYGRRL